MKAKILFLSIFALTLMIGCKKDSKNLPTGTTGVFDHGVFICNEGPFPTGTGTVCYVDRITGVLDNNIFEQANRWPLGNIVQSMEVINDKAYVVVNNANKIEVANIGDFKSIADIEGLSLPRFILPVSNKKAYVSCWSNSVSIIDLETNTLMDELIPTGTGPERMLLSGSHVFVLNQGGFDIDSTITVINTATDQVLNTIHVYPKPCGIVTDKNGKLWVICGGKGYNGWPGSDDSEGHLLRINPDSFTIEKDFPFPDNLNHPDKLVIDDLGENLFFLYKEGIYRMNIQSDALSTSPFVKHTGMLYALGFDKAGKQIYASDPVDFVQNGWVYRYQSVTGLPVDSFKTGIIPTYFTFR